MIYIVEDDENIREMESYALKNSGYDVKGFACGDELRAALATELPRLILLDIMLPGEDGLALLRAIRSDERTKRIPIMMVTAKTTELDKVRGLDMGADDYLSKPFGIMELVSRVKALIRRADSVPWSDMEALTASRIACWSGASSSVGECSQYFFP